MTSNIFLTKMVSFKYGRDAAAVVLVNLDIKNSSKVFRIIIY